MCKIFVLLSLILTGATASAEDINGAVGLYVQELMATNDFRSRWDPLLWEGYNQHRGDPNGGYVFRFGLRFGTDSQQLAFIGSDRFGDERGHAPSWNIYIHREQWLKIASDVLLSALEFYVDESKRTITEYFPDGTFSILHISRDGSVERTFHSAADLNDSMKKGEQRGARVEPEIEKVPIAAFLRSPNVKWRALRRQHAVWGQSLDAGDAELLVLAADLPWAEAKALAASLLEQQGKKPTASAAWPGSGSSLTRADQKASSHPEVSAPMTQAHPYLWPFIAISILCAVALLFSSRVRSRAQGKG